NTVQHIVQENLSLILKENIEIIGCGRTDTGVSASHYIAHFDCKAVIEDIENVIYKLNQMFPDDVVIHDMQLVHPDFHARFDAFS
nr:tRNA pseudouridine(38-40) synthase TruA [Saprospiraceae bacterium]